MSWTDKVSSLLKQYTTSGGAVAQPAPDVHAHFDEVAQAAPTSAIAEGLTAAFNSDKTPAFRQMLSTLFNNSTGDQKAGMVNHLLSSVSPLVRVFSLRFCRVPDSPACWERATPS
jgi:hypothetical protein